MGKLVEHALEEFKRLNWPGKSESQKWICEDLIELLEVFGKQGHSGFSASYILNLFEKLSKFEPLSPLTGEDDEWIDVGKESLDVLMFQNKRYSSVFKDTKDGKAYDINGKVFIDQDGNSYTSEDSKVYIEFPYTPKIEYVNVDKDDNEILSGG